MNGDHYAIVIGLSRYSGFRDPPADLQGPENDADCVHDWLIDPAGGALPPENVMRIKSSDEVPPDDRPSRDRLEERAFLWINDMAIANRDAGNGRKVGRRLYLYLSGHGFSPEARQGCLLAGNASPERVTANIGASLWLQWWQDAGYFREYVLLMDCCMNRTQIAAPTPAPLAAINVNDPPVASFIAFAAKRPLRAVEAPIAEDEGRYHGLFTVALLEGLRGAAVDSLGMVTGHSLANWLRSAVYPRLGEIERRDPDVSKEPEIIAEDGTLVFATGLAPRAFKAALRLPADAAGKAGIVWSGTPPVAHGFVGQAETELSLTAGLHLVEIPQAGYRQGIEVIRDETFTIGEKGAAVAATPGSFALLNVDAGDPTAGITVVRADFETVFAGEGRISVKLPLGIYKTRIRVGRQFVSRVVLLDGDCSQSGVTAAEAMVEAPAGAASSPEVLTLPSITSAVPFPGAPASHEYHTAPVAQASRNADVDVVRGEGAELLVMARNWSPSGQSAASEPWRGVVVRDAAGTVIADLEKDGIRHEAGDPFALCTIRLKPGTYFLHHPLAADRFEQALVVPAGWRLEAYLLRRYVGSLAEDTRPRLSLLMRRIGASWPSPLDETVEKARVALADERATASDELTQVMSDDVEDPIAGILGAHLALLRAESTGGTVSPPAFDEAVRRLRSLVGTAHPDVEALSLRCTDETLRHRTPFREPPLFERSWRLMIEASRTSPKLVPLALWQRVHALAPVPPFFVWSVSEAVQRDYSEALAEIALGERILVEPEAAGPESGAPPPELQPAGKPRQKAKPKKGEIRIDLTPRPQKRLVHEWVRGTEPQWRIPADFDLARAIEEFPKSLTIANVAKKPAPRRKEPEVSKEIADRAASLFLPPSALSEILKSRKR